MRALIVLLVAMFFLVPAALLLQQPPGPWSLLFHASGITLGIVGVLLVVVSLAMAAWRLVKGR